MIRASLFLAAAMLGMFAAATANAANIAVGLTDDVIEVDANFAGASVMVFGAVTGADAPADAYDIVAKIEGPPGDFFMSELKHNGLIWMPADRRRINDAPRFYATVATKAVGDVAPLPDQSQFQLGVDRIVARHKAEDPTRGAAFASALREAGLYRELVSGVSFLDQTLFTISIDLPSNTPVGDYAVTVFLYQNGVLMGSDDALLRVNKVGIERRIYELAHQRPVLYGLMCVALSLLAGWIAGVAFHRS